MTGDLWKVRTLPGGLTLELHGNLPALVIAPKARAATGGRLRSTRTARDSKRAGF
jgi:hypothetical protein